MKKFQPLLLAFLLPMMALAQETTADISGTVFTVDGKTGLSGATAVALHTPTGTKYTTTTRADGRFNFPNLRVGGPYTVMVTYVGYKEEKQENINLLLGQEFKVNFTLSSEDKLLDSVVVAGKQQNKIFSPNRMGMQEIISRSQIERLPTISRSLTDFTKLEPTSNGLSFGGRSNQYNNVTVDGANFNNSFGLSGTLGGQTNSQPISLDAIEQIQVNISPYDVTQGGFSGAGINSVTRSGTNQFKASAYGYIKNQDLQGYHVANTNVAKTRFYNVTRGFTVGGPIIKNKLFFFVSAEQVLQSVPATTIIASDATHIPGGNISVAKVDTLNKVRQFLITKFGYDPGAYQGYNFKTYSEKITAKIDWNINSTNIFTIKYNYLKSSTDQFASLSRPGGLTTPPFGSFYPGTPTNGLPFYSAGYAINNNFNIFIAELNTRFSNKASNKLQIGYTALRDYRTPHSPSSTFPFVDILDGAGKLYTSFGYEPYTYNNALNTDVYQLTDIFKLYKGSHELTFGTQNYYREYKNAFAPGYQGVYQFNTLNDFVNNVNSGTVNAKYYLQYSALPGGVFPFAYAGSTELGLFAQDKWTVTKNFTLTYGLRIDYTIYKQTFEDNPNFNALKFKNGTQYNIGKTPANLPLFSPRVGFNWDALGNKTLQIRGGMGVFAGPPPFVWISNQASNNGVQFGSFIQNNVVFNPDPTKYIPVGVSDSLPKSYSVALTDHNFKYPQVFKISLAADIKLPGDIILTLEGAGSRDINAVYFQNINLNEENPIYLTGADNRQRYTTNRYYAGTPLLSLANPNIGTAILMSNTSKGYAYTVTARLQKTFSNLYLSAAYTYSKAQNTAESGSTASSLWAARPVYQDPNNPTLANASYYQPHRFIAAASYRVEYAKYFATSIGLIFEAAPVGVGSYVYNKDLNNDGNSSNDLIYIPRSASEINLIDAGSYNSGTRSGATTGTATDPRTAAQIWTQLDNFIKQDPYLNFHRGEYAKANAVVLPFYKQLDLNITQDFYLKTGKDKHTLRVTLDLINTGNFLNRNWGLRQTVSSNNFLTFEGMAADGKTPLFSFPYYGDEKNQIPLTNSFTNSAGIASRWQMQLGFRYLFN